MEEITLDRAKFRMGLKTALLIMAYAVLNLLFDGLEHWILIGIAGANILFYLGNGVYLHFKDDEVNGILKGLTKLEISYLRDNLHGSSFIIEEAQAKNLIAQDLVLVKKRNRIK